MKESTPSTDALVIGGGPAGCAAAISCLGVGKSVTVLEADPAERKIPGETLHPAAEPIFKQLGIWEAVLDHKFHRPSGIWRENESGERLFAPYGHDTEGDWLGFQVNRPALNDILRRRVVQLGGTLRWVKHLKSAHRTEDAAWQVRADEEEYRATVLFDATGRSGWLAGQLALRPDTRGPSQRLSFGWNAEARDHLHGNPLFRRCADGWDWFAPLGTGFNAWARLRRESSTSGLDATWRIFNECAGPGYFLLGDAACYMDPSAANGVVRAMMSGIYAAHLATMMVDNHFKPKDAIHEYRRWVSELFETTYGQIMTSV